MELEHNPRKNEYWLHKPEKSKPNEELKKELDKRLEEIADEILCKVDNLIDNNNIRFVLEYEGTLVTFDLTNRFIGYFQEIIIRDVKRQMNSEIKESSVYLSDRLYGQDEYNNVSMIINYGLEELVTKNKLYLIYQNKTIRIPGISVMVYNQMLKENINKISKHFLNKIEDIFQPSYYYKEMLYSLPERIESDDDYKRYLTIIDETNQFLNAHAAIENLLLNSLVKRDEIYDSIDNRLKLESEYVNELVDIAIMRNQRSVMLKAYNIFNPKINPN